MLSLKRVFRSSRLSEVENGRLNNLNLIRFFLASGVVFTHCYTQAGLGNQEPLLRLTHEFSTGTLAVWAFFFISGYLILKSALRSTPERFLSSRVLRIFPALITAVLLCTFVLGPATTTLPLHSYFGNPMTRSFLSQMWLHRVRLALPGVFNGPRDTSDVLPTLWTLPGEWSLYILTMLACMIVRWRSIASLTRLGWVAVFGSIALTIQMLPLSTPFGGWARFFALGAACYLLRRWIWLSVPIAVLIFFFDLFLLSGTSRIGVHLFPYAMGYLLLTIGFHPGVCVTWFHRVGDYSYGLYIFAFPLQQLGVAIAGKPWSLFVLTYPFALLVAALSWHFIEQPFLKLKTKPTRPVPREKVPADLSVLSA